MEPSRRLEKLRHLPDVHSRHQSPRPLAENVHGNAQKADGNLDTRDDYEGVDDAVLEYPAIGGPGQGEGEHILEDQERGEGLDRDVTFRKRQSTSIRRGVRLSQTHDRRPRYKERMQRHQSPCQQPRKRRIRRAVATHSGRH